MENKSPQNDPQNHPNLDGTNQTDDRPKTPSDGFLDQGTKTDELNEEPEKTTNAETGEIPALNPDRNDVEGQQPTDFDIDESTG